MTSRVVVVDDNLLVREGVLRLLEPESDLEVVAACADPKEAMAAVRQLRPDVVLTDIRMPPDQRDEGLVLARELRAEHPAVGVVVLSQHVSPDYAISLLDQGSDGRGYLLKDRLAASGEIAEALRIVAGGGCRIDALVVEALVEGRRLQSPLGRLTAREREILADIAEGLSNDAIAERRVITRRAVEKHASAVFVKLGLTNAQHTSRRVKATLMYLAMSER